MSQQDQDDKKDSRDFTRPNKNRYIFTYAWLEILRFYMNF